MGGLLAILLLVGAGCVRHELPLQIAPPVFSGAAASLQIFLGSDFVEGSLVLELDGEAIAPPLLRQLWGVSGSLAPLGGGTHRLEARARFLRDGGEVEFSDAREFRMPTPTPALLESSPAGGAGGVPRSEWISLRFAEPVANDARAHFELICGGPVPVARQAIEVHALGSDRLVVNPAGELPAAADCVLQWQGPTRREFLPFSTAGAGPAAQVLYDRGNARSTAPFPDDFWLVDDATTPTGVRLDIPVPDGPPDLRQIFEALLPETSLLDGFSPIAHFVVELSDAPDPTSLPRTPAESLDPLASAGLFDLTAGPGFGSRVPFKIEVRADTSPTGLSSHSLLVFPSIPLMQGGRYGFVITRRARVDATRPLDPSAFFAAVKAAPLPGEPAALTRVRPLAEEVLGALASAVSPPIPRDDVALALRISVRSADAIPDDLLAIKADVLATAPPAFSVTSVTPDSVAGSDVAAIVRGTWQAPEYRSGPYLERDADGRPVRVRTRAIPFILALPRAALDGPVPIVMYQHGNPGSSEAEVPGHARRSLATAGFAVIGFTDPLNREVLPNETDPVKKATGQVLAVFLALLEAAKIPDYWVETNAEQLAFVRGLQALGALDVLPIGAPDGVPDLDPSAPLGYVGISEGANHGPGLLPYAPEIRAAALVAGGRRFAEVLVHQQAETLLTQIAGFFPSLTPADTWVGLAVFQAIFDNQDEHHHARFLFRDPFPVDGSMQKANVLVVEGLDDSLVPNHATESIAWWMGPIPHLLPVQRAVPFLATTTGPVVANVDSETTAAFYQYVPVGVPGIAPTPGCVTLPPSSGREGHYCAQSAAESLRQRVVFFQSALGGGAATIIDPLSE